jgi:hypothetical protein
MDASDATELIGSFIGEDGEPVTISRITNATTTPPTRITATCQGFVRDYRPNELGNGILQGDSNISIEGNSLPQLAQRLGTAPRKNDKISYGGFERNIEMVVPIRIGGQVVRINMLARG